MRNLFYEDLLKNGTLYFKVIDPINKVYMAMHLRMLRVVYGGDYTILLDKKTGDRICRVKREKTERPNLTKAILYLLLKSEGIYGREIQGYFDNYCYSYMGLMEYLLEYGSKSSYSRDDLRRYKEMIDNEDDDELGFLYVLIYDRFGINKEDIDILVKEAICSETDKTKLRKLKKRKIKKHSKVVKKNSVESREELEKL